VSLLVVLARVVIDSPPVISIEFAAVSSLKVTAPATASLAETMTL